jgi:hypothetical protein
MLLFGLFGPHVSAGGLPSVPSATELLSVSTFYIARLIVAAKKNRRHLRYSPSVTLRNDLNELNAQ